MEKNRNKIVMALLFVVISGGMYFWGVNYSIPSPARYINKAANTNTNSIEVRELVENDTNIIYEREYVLSRVVIISSFKDSKDIIGRGIDEIRDMYTSQQGFTIDFREGSLIIHQRIDDWTPEDKLKFRLKDFKGFLAVYQGPNIENDVMLRVTSLKLSKMPRDIQEAILAGKYEFKSEDELNDALENLDEYL